MRTPRNPRPRPRYGVLIGGAILVLAWVAFWSWYYPYPHTQCDQYADGSTSCVVRHSHEPVTVSQP